MENLIIEPLKGYGDIKFGMSIDEVVNVFGTPSNHEELEPIIEGNEISSILYDYDDIAVSVCFEGTDDNLCGWYEDGYMIGVNKNAYYVPQIVEMANLDIPKEAEAILIAGDIYDKAKFIP